MSRTEKQYHRLESLEQDLAEKLRHGLIESARGGFCWVFDSPETQPYLGKMVLNRPKVRDIVGLVHEIRALRQKLGEAESEGIVGRYDFWSEHNFSEDENRLGPKRLAKAFLAEIDELQHGVFVEKPK